MFIGAIILKNVLAQWAIKHRCQEANFIGLGAGRTVATLVEAFLQQEHWIKRCRWVCAWPSLEEKIRQRGGRIVQPSANDRLDLLLDSADEVLANGISNKGQGGALLKERWLAHYTRTYGLLVEENKWVDALGKRGVTVETIPYGEKATTAYLQQFGQVHRRITTSEWGHWLYTVETGLIADPVALRTHLMACPGVCEVGLFTHPRPDWIAVGKKQTGTVSLHTV